MDARFDPDPGRPRRCDGRPTPRAPSGAPSRFRCTASVTSSSGASESTACSRWASLLASWPRPPALPLRSMSVRTNSRCSCNSGRSRSSSGAKAGVPRQRLALCALLRWSRNQPLSGRSRRSRWFSSCASGVAPSLPGDLRVVVAAALLGASEWASDGRFTDNVFALGGSGITGLGAVARAPGRAYSTRRTSTRPSGSSFHLPRLHSGALLLRDLDVFHAAWFAALAVLVVTLADVGAWSTTR